MCERYSPRLGCAAVWLQWSYIVGSNKERDAKS